MTTASGRIDELLASMTLAEQASLTAGEGMFSIGGAERVGVPAWPVTDGPNGARGSSLLGTGEAVALCIPCGSALAATWNRDLVERLGHALGVESRTKQAAFLLAPTVNIVRSPLAGRNFECYGEDPLLSGRTAAAFVRGVQAEGVGVTVKHLLGNEAETERYTTDSIIDERTMREIYLRPFELAVVEGGALGIMTAYNRVNGDYVTVTGRLLNDIVRGDWGFEGIFMTDWYGALATVEGAAAGIDIEMPGGGPALGQNLVAAVETGEVAEELVVTMARRVLHVYERLGLFDRKPETEYNELLPEAAELAREAAADAMVLLKNDNVLPLRITRADQPEGSEPISSVAVVGPNAFRAQIMGGGSANLRPQFRISPLEAITAAVGPGVDVRSAVGGDIDKDASTMKAPLVEGPEGPGVLPLDLIAGLDPNGEVVRTATLDQTKIVFGDSPVDHPDGFSARLRGELMAPATGTYRFVLTSIGDARFTMEGNELISTYGIDVARGDSFFGGGSEPLEATVELVAGQRYSFTVELSSTGAIMGAVDVGVSLPESDDPVADAVAVAEGCDVAIVVVGTNDDWESEGIDRQTLDLPGRQDELVRRVVEANPHTVVVLNTGAPVHVPWVDEVPAVIQTWFGGQGMAEALADVLLGQREPGGRLPVTFPVRQEHAPSHPNFPGSNGVVRYGEGIFVGYRGHQHQQIAPAFSFGHGLSYTAFEISNPQLSTGELSVFDQVVTTTAEVTNVGDRYGRHVVQVYVAGPQPDRASAPPRAPLSLQGWEKVSLEPGQTATVSIELTSRSLARWHDPDPGWADTVVARQASLRMFQIPELDPDPGWVVDAGTYEIVVATSCVDEVARLPLRVPAYLR